ncbi:MAG: winged helix-turn-helix domain-containing protein [Ignavibacteriaceae bacterium]|nr:winged helix-turn-helix domain-containing protein [Ignavibacteriaceae bacterium]
MFNEISGTSGITGAMDTMLVLKKKGKSGKLYVTGRDVKDVEYNLVFDETICCWNVVEEEINTTAERKEIYELIKSSGREMKTGEIAELLGKTVPNVSKMLGKMLKEELLATEKTGYYFIPEDKKGKGFKVKNISLFNDHKDGESG